MQAQGQRLEARARELWKADGAPPGKMDDYVERARELIAIETNGDIARIPVKSLPDPSTEPYGEPVEPLEAIKNQGEFPTLTDQGEEQLFPEDEDAQSVDDK
ncbi:MAG: hypothetical protein K0S54_3513 [Alphaproteobacteria bacterium]|jgi:hypothetical protein|nr:hypothetical protein [Alphaproteobacteria bacterium]